MPASSHAECHLEKDGPPGTLGINPPPLGHKEEITIAFKRPDMRSGLALGTSTRISAILMVHNTQPLNHTPPGGEEEGVGHPFTWEEVRGGVARAT